MRQLTAFVFLLALVIPSWGLAPPFRQDRWRIPGNGRTFRCVARPLSRENNDAGPSSSSKEALLREEALVLLQKAQDLRRQIPEDERQEFLGAFVAPIQSKWNVPWNTTNSDNRVGYRLYVDIGREEGTWMDPRWGASQRRIEFTLDVAFVVSGVDGEAQASRDMAARMVADNLGGSRSPVYRMNVAPAARLRNGFAEMECLSDGAYRLDTNRGAMASNTIRFLASTQGTEDDISYGDINVPKGDLYFSLPAFGSGVQNLSRKEGIVSVRQMGWNTGWRRLESRIVGTFRAVPIEEARQRDGF